MKQKVRNLIESGLRAACADGSLPAAEFPGIEVETPKLEAHGDISTNIAMVMSSGYKMAPRKIAEIVIKHLYDPEMILEKTEIAGPGFINFFIRPGAWLSVLNKIHEQGSRYGATDIGKGKKVQVEFVSANPTGPLHVGHGRGAAVGDSVANILSFCGYDVQKEYYINDSGRQIQTLGRSVFLRYREICGDKIDFPSDCYQGDYIREIAEQIKNGKENPGPEESEAISYCARFAAKLILEGIRSDLESFGVSYDKWFSEQALYDSGLVDTSIDHFRKSGVIYEKDGALWFRTTDFGDEKDRVVVRQTGQTTYFASDIAYHRDKYKRGFDRVIDVWGADHHGYIPRMRAAILASGQSAEQFDVILVHLVNLLRGGVPVAMSTRAGEFVTLNDVIKEVGKDAARFLFLTRHYESPLDFDLELAKQQTNDNPVYYVQYVHARISSILKKGQEKGIDAVVKSDTAIDMLTTPEEIGIVKTLARYPETIAYAATFMEPHRITYYLMDLAAAFHAYYNKHRVLTDDPVLTQGRLYMVLAVKKVIQNGLDLLGVSAPDQM